MYVCVNVCLRIYARSSAYAHDDSNKSIMDRY